MCIGRASEVGGGAMRECRGCHEHVYITPTQYALQIRMALSACIVLHQKVPRKRLGKIRTRGATRKMDIRVKANSGWLLAGFY